MEKNSQKCSSIEHEEKDAISFCFECKVYMCNKCESFHSKLCKHHHWFNLGKNINETFTGFCTEENHMEKLEYFCKSHNKLCCGFCITKIKGKEKGQHKDCDVCFIEEIKEEKKNKFNDNLTNLENLSEILDEKINQLKLIIAKINESKEELKLKIKKIFTKIRSELNDREDKLLLEIDKNFNEKLFNEDLIKESEKLPNKVKTSLENGKLIHDDWKDENKLCSYINNCIIIENNIKDINLINEKLSNYNNSKDFKINFYPDKEEEIQQFIEKIKHFGDLNEFIINSKIINNEDAKLIKNWISNNNINFSLLYRMSDDGDSFKAFHDKCDNQYPALFFAKTKEGYKFGGYTSIGWNSQSNTYLPDKKAFLFSLNKKEKYELLDNTNVIGCYNSRGVDFNNDCYFYQNNMTKCYSSGDYAFLKGKGKVLANNNNTTFIVDEVEIFKII